MRTATSQLALLAASLFLFLGWAESCNPEDTHYGCKLQGDSCHCADDGCKYEYPYRNKLECLAAYREHNRNICNHNPCIRGTCLQVNQDPGYSCGCQGTGFYGQRCEKVCPTAAIRGLQFPYECIVI